MDLIPALDIIDGCCVRLEKGDFSRKIIYSNDPVEVATAFEDAGIHFLHIVDLDGAGGDSLRNIHVLRDVCRDTSLVVDYGGGIRTTAQVSQVLEAGAAMISVGSVLVKEPALFSEWLNAFGNRKFLPGADVLGGKIKIHGWKEGTNIDIFDFIEGLTKLDLNRIFCTDISKDGMMQGPSTELYKAIIKRFPALHLIASGGISCHEDLLALRDAGCKGAIIGKAFYEGKISLARITEFLKDN
jgi:phosphoribosylformimino-5-aminoimidazole carboxamide ribotide isomerase